MIKITFTKNKDEKITAFKVDGHDEFTGNGGSVICAGVSALVISTVNSIEKFTDDKSTLKEDAKKGLIEYNLINAPSDKASLLLDSLEYGLQSIEEIYGRKNVEVKNKNNRD